MKAVMYHYVRTGDRDLPYFRYLHIDDFRRQLDYFQENYAFPAQGEFLDALHRGEAIKGGLILTFDDGLKDHLEVAQELSERGLWGIFYIPVGPWLTNKMLDVHRAHLLLGRYGGAPVLKNLEGILREDMLSHDHIAEFRNMTYAQQENDVATTQVKRILNYFIADHKKESALDELTKKCMGKNEVERVDEFYLSRADIKAMHDMGMVIGAHTVSHPVMSKLDIQRQEEEITQSFAYVESITGKPSMKTFSYPYGSPYTYTAETIQLLNGASCEFSFCVDPRDISNQDLLNHRQALPRFDCNMFPHGAASMGA